MKHKTERFTLSNRQTTLLEVFAARESVPAAQAEAIDGRTLRTFVAREWVRQHGHHYTLTARGRGAHDALRHTNILRAHSDITMAQLMRRAKLAIVRSA